MFAARCWKSSSSSDGVIASAVFFLAIFWGDSFKDKETMKLNKLIKKAGSVLGWPMESFEVVLERSALNKLLFIHDSELHPLHELMFKQQSTCSSCAGT